MVNPLDKLLPSARPIDLPPVAIIGLGRFGSAMAEELHSHGVDVLGIDVDEKLLHDSDAHLTDSFIADATDPEALKQLGVKDFQQVVIGIGSSLEASILTASNLVELGVKDIWAKADSDAHARILTRVGVHHVVRPERDTGRRVAHLLSGRFQDYTVFDQGYAMITLRAPKGAGEPLPQPAQPVGEAPRSAGRRAQRQSVGPTLRRSPALPRRQRHSRRCAC